MALSNGSLRRMDRLYKSTQWGIILVPSITQDFSLALADLDSYVAAVPYTGLTLMGLLWASDKKQTNEVHGRPGAVVIGAAKYPKVGVLNNLKTWAALRGGESYALDPRSVPGILGIKIHTNLGWAELLTGRAKSSEDDQKPGPLLDSGATPMNVQVSSTGKNTLLMQGVYTSGQPMRLLFSLLSCGVQIQAQSVSSHKISLNLLIPGNALSITPGLAEWNLGKIQSSSSESITQSAGSPTATSLVNINLKVTGKSGRDLNVSVSGKNCT